MAPSVLEGNGLAINAWSGPHSGKRKGKHVGTSRLSEPQRHGGQGLIYFDWLLELLARFTTNAPLRMALTRNSLKKKAGIHCVELSSFYR